MFKYILFLNPIPTAAESFLALGPLWSILHRHNQAKLHAIFQAAEPSGRRKKWRFLLAISIVQIHEFLGKYHFWPCNKLGKAPHHEFQTSAPSGSEEDYWIFEVLQALVNTRDEQGLPSQSGFFFDKHDKLDVRRHFLGLVYYNFLRQNRVK